MGYWPSKLICVLNIINQVGWGAIASVVAGQMLSAVNGVCVLRVLSIISRHH